MLLAYTGGGKGKTTAALGLALRAWGHDMRVLTAFLMKTPRYLNDYTGEYKALRRLGVKALYLEDHKTPRELLEEALSEADEYDLVVLDEFNYAVRQGFLGPSDVKRLLGLKPHVVITGNFEYPELYLADLVSEVVAKKHYYQKGAVGVRGLDW
ncbi:MAG: cob(I)yrinic acid a,c-diamide adenosyltransferase [Thermoproteus sp. AZ2]|jgi:cob(I)alamin adenosyltransferase|uniref:Cob(I)yrinic acid a,c-diamide adenosyltransferase n=1 Tax=Thermoproteus sp. AZ2 TaxID=1609232 RepID=A0ACC6V1D1_9CREN|nr:MAG: cob(I)alamin adenolsyltransferase [Thermoproteus sp. AZ2]